MSYPPPSGRPGTGQVRPIVFALLTLWLVACSTTTMALRPTAPPNHTYVLDAAIEPRLAIKRSNAVLLVATPRAQPGFDTRRIAYTKTPLSLNYYTKSEWADTPAQMLAPLLVRALESTGGFRAVLSTTAPVEADLRLDIDIIRLQQEFLETSSHARLALRAKLYDLATRQILATQIFEAAEPAPSEDAYGGVRAANAAVKRLLDEIANFVLVNAFKEAIPADRRQLH